MMNLINYGNYVKYVISEYVYVTIDVILLFYFIRYNLSKSIKFEKEIFYFIILNLR